MSEHKDLYFVKMHALSISSEINSSYVIFSNFNTIQHKNWTSITLPLLKVLKMQALNSGTLKSTQIKTAQRQQTN